jgi:hypothetical protein
MCDVILRGVLTNFDGLVVFVERFKCDAIALYVETNCLLKMFAPFVVRGNIAMTLNIVLHEVVTEFSAVVRTVNTETNSDIGGSK